MTAINPESRPVKCTEETIRNGLSTPGSDKILLAFFSFPPIVSVFADAVTAA